MIASFILRTKALLHGSLTDGRPKIFSTVYGDQKYPRATLHFQFITSIASIFRRFCDLFLEFFGWLDRAIMFREDLDFLLSLYPLCVIFLGAQSIRCHFLYGCYTSPRNLMDWRYLHLYAFDIDWSIDHCPCMVWFMLGCVRIFDWWVPENRVARHTRIHAYNRGTWMWYLLTLAHHGTDARVIDHGARAFAQLQPKLVVRIGDGTRRQL